MRTDTAFEPAIGLADIRQAAERLRGVANRTPVVTSRTVDDLVGGRARGTSLALGGENHRRRQFASLQAKSRVVGREPVGDTNCWARLQILRITPLPDHSMSRDVLRPR